MKTPSTGEGFDAEPSSLKIMREGDGGCTEKERKTGNHMRDSRRGTVSHQFQITRCVS